MSENAASQIYSLPMFAVLTYAQQERIFQHLLEFVDAEPNSGISTAFRIEGLTAHGGQGAPIC